MSSLCIQNSTQVPNVLLDTIMPSVSPADWKLLSFICRKTFGWQKTQDRISLSQFVKGTGLSMKWVIQRLALFAEQGLLIKTDSSKGSLWEINLKCDFEAVRDLLQSTRSSRASSKSPLVSPVTKPNQTKPSRKSSGLSFYDSQARSNRTDSQTRCIEDAKDERHIPVREEIKRMWLRSNPGAGEAPWSGAEGSLLSGILKANPSWKLEAVLTCVVHRFRSECNHSEQPRRWLHDLLSYFGGPLDRYRNPKPHLNETGEQ